MSTTKRIHPQQSRKEREVWQACDSLHEESRPLTYLAIGEQLVKMGYKRGSNSDIRRYLKTWRKKHLPIQALPMLSHALSNTMANPPTTAAPLAKKGFETASERDLVAFYQHHLDQFDRLISIIEMLKKENLLLRNMLSKYPKPRITCHPLVNSI